MSDSDSITLFPGESRVIEVKTSDIKSFKDERNLLIHDGWYTEKGQMMLGKLEIGGDLDKTEGEVDTFSVTPILTEAKENNTYDILLSNDSKHFLHIEQFSPIALLTEIAMI